MQVSIVNEMTFFLSNQVGELAKITKTLAEKDVNVKGILISEGFGKSVVKMVVDDELKAMKIMEDMGISDITLGQILAVLMPSKKGQLAELSDLMGKANINIENIYGTESTQGDTLAYVSVVDVDEAMRIFG